MDKKETNKKQAEVESMFDSIAWRYDFLNHFLSLGTDFLWRKRAVRRIKSTHSPKTILDVATGTGDMALELLRLHPDRITGIDISSSMLEIGRRKIRKRGLTGRIELMKAPSEAIPFADSEFDAVTSAFGVRNFSDTMKGLREMKRVLKPGGILMVLEFSKPVTFPFSQIYRLYFLHILPFFGRIFSRNTSAYSYLPESVMHFPENEEFLKILKEAGFVQAEQKRLSGGIATIYTAVKPALQ